MHMTNEELLEDLKQFVRGTVSQAVSGLATQADLDALNAKLEAVRAEMVTKADLRSAIDGVRSEVVDGMNQQTETIVAAIEAVDHRQTARLDDHETRISRLEHRAV